MTRNLTAGNIKLTAEGHIKVYNLELAYVAQDEHGDRQAMPKVEGPVGLDAYMPPEVRRWSYWILLGLTFRFNGFR